MANNFQQARREMERALRRAQEEQDRINRENRRRLNDYNRKVATNGSPTRSTSTTATSIVTIDRSRRR